MNHIIFNVRTALDRAIDEPELLTEDDRGYLKLLRTSVFNITTAGQKLLGVYQDKNNPDDSVRYMAGLSPNSAPTRVQMLGILLSMNSVPLSRY